MIGQALGKIMSNNDLTIVMYHYVRPIKNSQWPKLKGLEIDGFKRQLDYLSQNYKFVKAEDVIDATILKKELPKNACWLTFDDGYKDHYHYVLPELINRKIQGSFFPPVKAITERLMLDVNSIHHILAASRNLNDLISDLNLSCIENGFTDRELKFFWDEHAISGKYDTKEVIYFKRMLQHVLPEQIRSNITSTLFKRYVGLNQKDFADNLYMSTNDIKELVSSGMYVGSHGYSHLWLNKTDKISQKLDIALSLQFLASVGIRTKDWIMCYPYGGHNIQTLEILHELDCAVGITTEVGKANLAINHPLKLPRFDTNDFPK